MECPCCGHEMRNYETLVDRRGWVTARLWSCPRCAEPEEYGDPSTRGICVCESEGDYFEMPEGSELQEGGRHLL